MKQGIGNSGWEGILEPGEDVLWQGQPDASVDLKNLRLGSVIVGLIAIGFSLFWTINALSTMKDAGLAGILFPLFGLFFVVVGAQRAGGVRIWDSYRRKHTWYTLTSRRAFIATDMFGRKDLAAYPITRGTVLDHDGTTPGNIWFAMDFVRTRQGDRKRRIGFERLDDSTSVFGMMVDVQRANA